MSGFFERFRVLRMVRAGLLGALTIACVSGCWAPFRSYGIPACELGDEFRSPARSHAPMLNLADLTAVQSGEYRLGSGDILEISVPGLYDGSEARPMKISVMDDGNIHLPMIGSVAVGGTTLVESQKRISAAYADGFLLDPRVNVTLFQPGKVDVVVLGEVESPGVHSLPRSQSDVGHALAMAGGLSDFAAESIEVHRSARVRSASSRFSDLSNQVQSETDTQRLMPIGHSEMFPSSSFLESTVMSSERAPGVTKIPLRGFEIPQLNRDDVRLKSGDVIKVPRKTSEVFFVVGRLNQTNNVRFTVGDVERELGVGFILPRDRDIDVVAAVAMAGYIDPIDSPTTVTVHRILPDGEPFLVKVDLIKARYDRRESIYVKPGDIIYLNPDFAWWARRTFDRIINNVLVLPYQNAIFN